MNWPQWTILALQAVGMLLIVVRNIKDRSISSERATFTIIFWLAFLAAYDGVLHAGGFW